MDRSDLENALRGLDFPAPRNKLVAKALENRAPLEVVERIRQLPETADFLSPDELSEALGIEVRDVRTPHDWE